MDYGVNGDLHVYAWEESLGDSARRLVAEETMKRNGRWTVTYEGGQMLKRCVTSNPQPPSPLHGGVCKLHPDRSTCGLLHGEGRGHAFNTFYFCADARFNTDAGFTGIALHCVLKVQ